MSNQHYTDIINSWDPSSETDLPDEVALHMDDCEQCTAAFDERFTAWEDTATAAQEDEVVDRPPRRPSWMFYATVAASILIASAVVVTESARNLSASFNTIANATAADDDGGAYSAEPWFLARGDSKPNKNPASARSKAKVQTNSELSGEPVMDAGIREDLHMLGYLSEEEEDETVAPSGTEYYSFELRGRDGEQKLKEEEGLRFKTELKSVEEDISNLKGRVFHSKARLTLLKELVIEGDGQQPDDFYTYDGVADVGELDGRYANVNGKDLFWSDTLSTGEGYRDYGVNGFDLTSKDKLSTFAIDVDTASYTLSRRKLNEGYLPAPASVRVEEFVNYFPYDYIPPSSSPFAVAFEAAPTPWNGNTWLVRVGVQGKKVSYLERKPVHLTFLVDTSGSMRSADKMELMKASLRMLTKELEDGDTVALVAYAGSAGVILEPTPMSRKSDILAALNRLHSGGSTAMGSGIDLAYRLAEQTSAPGAVNRVIIASDGDANVGQTNQKALSAQIKRYAKRGITLTTIGFGTGNYQDAMMEQLANQGDGNYFYIDSEREARRIFVDKLCSTMQVIAKDVKIQVDWNKDLVKAYRLVGYENRDIADRDFRNDAVDAGEIGAGHQVTALYEVVLTRGETANLATVRIRNKAPGPEAPAVERSYEMPKRLLQHDFDETSADFRIATAAAGFAELLRHSPHIHEMKYRNLAHIARYASRPEYAEDQELVNLLEQAARLSGE